MNHWPPAGQMKLLLLSYGAAELSLLICMRLHQRSGLVARQIIYSC